MIGLTWLILLTLWCVLLTTLSVARRKMVEHVAAQNTAFIHEFRVLKDAIEQELAERRRSGEMKIAALEERLEKHREG